MTLLFLNPIPTEWLRTSKGYSSNYILNNYLEIICLDFNMNPHLVPEYGRNNKCKTSALSTVASSLSLTSCNCNILPCECLRELPCWSVSSSDGDTSQTQLASFLCKRPRPIQIKPAVNAALHSVPEQDSAAKPKKCMSRFTFTRPHAAYVLLVVQMYFF